MHKKSVDVVAAVIKKDNLFLVAYRSFEANSPGISDHRAVMLSLDMSRFMGEWKVYEEVREQVTDPQLRARMFEQIAERMGNQYRMRLMCGSMWDGCWDVLWLVSTCFITRFACQHAAPAMRQTSAHA